MSVKLNNKQTDIICRRTFLSGRHKRWYNFFISARGCLTVTLTMDRLRIRPFFPFSLFGKSLDLDINIPVTDIQNIELRRNLFCPTLYIYYKKDGKEKVFILYLFSILIPRSVKPWIEGFEKIGIEVKI